MDFQIYDDIISQIQIKNQQINDENQKIKYIWLLSLQDQQNNALDFIFFSKLLNQSISDQINNQEVRNLLKKEFDNLQVQIPNGINITGILMIESEIAETNQLIQQALISYLKQFKSMYRFYSKQLSLISIKHSFKLSSKEQSPIIGWNIDDNKLYEKCILMKQFEINELIKNYFVLSTSYCEMIGQKDQLNNQDFISQQLKYIQYAKLSKCNEIFLNEYSSNKLQIQGKQELKEDLVQKYFVEKKTLQKDKFTEFGKANQLFRPLTIEVNLFSQIHNSDPEQLLGIEISNYAPDIKLSIDAVSYVKINSNYREAIQQHLQYFFSLGDQLQAQTILQKKIKAQYSFLLNNHPIIVQNMFDIDINQYRQPPTFQDKQENHYLYNLPNDQCCLKYENRILLRQNLQDKLQDGKLKNVHLFLPYKANDLFSKHYIQGDYVYYHYLQDNFDDKGWGCAYRSLQTILSWFNEQSIVKNFPIPNHKDIQNMLFEMGDKPAAFIGSKEWIGAFEVSYIIQKLTGADCKIIHLENGIEIETKLDELIDHFQREGTPIMLGGGVLAFTLLGIDYNQENIQETKYLILDPHYTGADNIKSIIDKGGIAWRKKDIFLPNTFYNFCLPIRPKGI